MPSATQMPETEMAQLQRELADKITGHAPLDDIRICLASGAQVSRVFKKSLFDG